MVPMIYMYLNYGSAILRIVALVLAILCMVKYLKK